MKALSKTDLHRLYFLELVQERRQSKYRLGGRQAECGLLLMSRRGLAREFYIYPLQLPMIEYSIDLQNHHLQNHVQG